MRTKTTKKPRARKPRTRTYSKEYTELRTELIRYINDRHGVLSGEMLTLRDDIRELVLEDAKVHINRHCGLGHEGLRAYTDKKIDELAKQMVRTSQLDDLRQHVGKISDHIEETLKLLDERLGDEVNKGHALYRRVGELEQELRRALTIEDLRKTNVTISLLEKNIEEMEKRREHDANAHNLLVGEVEKLKTTAAFGCEDVQPCSTQDVVKALQSAKQRVATQQDRSAVSAITYCTLPGELRSRALLAMCLGVSAIWELTPNMPTVLTDNIICQLLHEWHDGMVTSKEDVLLAFDVSIKRSSR